MVTNLEAFGGAPTACLGDSSRSTGAVRRVTRQGRSIGGHTSKASFPQGPSRVRMTPETKHELRIRGPPSMTPGENQNAITSNAPHALPLSLSYVLLSPVTVSVTVTRNATSVRPLRKTQK